MFTKTAKYYDKIYSFKDYHAEAQRLLDIVEEKLHSGGDRLLDVACGTGKHIQHLMQHFEVEGLDVSMEFLDIARKRTPDVTYHYADMMDFDLGRKFDVLTCLFGSIGYVKTLANLDRALGCMTNHLYPGGILVVEPWFTPDAWNPGTVHAVFVDEPELKIARINTSFLEGRLSFFDLHYLIGTPEGTEHFVERHELGLFEVEEMHAAFVKVGLEVIYDEEGLTGRGLFIGRRPLRDIASPWLA